MFKRFTFVLLCTMALLSAFGCSKQVPVSSQSPTTSASASVSQSTWTVPSLDNPGNGGLVLATETETHVIRPGDTLEAISRETHIPLETLLEKNQAKLQAVYDQVCTKENIRPWFCNQKRGNQPRHTLVPGETLVLTEPQVFPTEISAVVDEAAGQINSVLAKAPGKTVVIVFDDTGSMSDDREWTVRTLGSLTAIHSKEIISVIAYTDKKIWQYKKGEEVLFRNSGGYENTWQAITEAKNLNPDIIILISDEEGDDWGADSLNLQTAGSKPLQMIAVCLPSGDYAGCSQSFAKLVEANKAAHSVLCDLSKK